MDHRHDHNSATGARCWHRRSARVTKAVNNSQPFGQLPKMRPKSLPSQFGQKCDIKEAGNTQPSEKRLSLPCSTPRAEHYWAGNT